MMLKIYWKIAWRQLLRKPQLSSLKIIGLSLGIAASLLLINYISWTWNFDRFHTNYEEIVRIQNDHFQGQELRSRSAQTYAGVPIIAKNNFPKVKNYVRFTPWIANDVVFRNGENMYRGKNCYFADSTFFEVFSFGFEAGNPQYALSEPNSIVLSASIAASLFGDTNPIGKELLFENKKVFKVTGIVKDPPVQSHIQFDMIASMSTLTNWNLEIFGDNHLSYPNVYAYLHLEKSTNLEDLAQSITKKVNDLKPQDKNTDVFHLQSLSQIHLYSDLDHELGPTGAGLSLWILMSIAVLILILGWSNHINLFVASALEQIKPISIRKIIGAKRKNLFFQILTATSLINLLAMVIGIGCAIIAAPFLTATFNIPFDIINLNSLNFSDPSFYLLLLLVLGTLLSSFMPAILLSNINPKQLIANQFQKIPGNLNLQSILVGFQFFIIIGLISSTFIIYQQSQHIQEKDIGINLDNVIAIRGPLGAGYENLKRSLPEFQQKIKAFPEVERMSLSKEIPGNELELINIVKNGTNEYPFSFYRNYGNVDYFDLYKIPFLARDTTNSFLATDFRYVVINKLALVLLGFDSPKAALGKKISIFGSDFQIAGVVDNHHQRSLHYAISPIIYDFYTNTIMEDGYFSFKIRSGSTASVLPKIKAAYQAAFPYTVFDQIDVKPHFELQYESDNHFKYLNLGFTFLALIISSLGLLGLVIMAIEKKTKEMTIRKILGATVNELLYLLSKEYLILAIISWLIALPLTWYLMNNWLMKFSSRIAISAVPFFLAGMTVFVSICVVVLYQSNKIASLNPVDNLNKE